MIRSLQHEPGFTVKIVLLLRKGLRLETPRISSDDDGDDNDGDLHYALITLFSVSR